MSTPVQYGQQFRIELELDPFIGNLDSTVISDLADCNTQIEPVPAPSFWQSRFRDLNFPDLDNGHMAVSSTKNRPAGEDTFGTAITAQAFEIDGSSNVQMNDSWDYAAQFQGAAFANDIVGTTLDDRLFGTPEDDTLSGGDGEDKLYGRLGDDLLYGEADDDKLWGEEGDDQLFGGDGNDMLNGGSGIDHMEGGTGNDTYIVDHEDELVVEFGGEGIDDIRSSTISLDLFWYENVENARLTGAEDLDATGDNGANTVNGNDGNNVIAGLGNSDNLKGGDGNDHLFGGSGNDVLKGNDGNDRLVGGSGIDNLTGGRGRDLLVGGLGNDVFVYRDVDQSGTTNSSRDLVADFVQGEDRLYLKGIDASVSENGNQAFDFIGIAEFGGVAGELRYVQIGSRTHVQADTDGDGISDFELALSGLFTLTATDFTL